SPVNVKDIKLEEGEIGLVAWEKEENTKSLSEIKDKVLNASKIKIVIGPEGGITMDEFETLKANGFTPISLGNRILRSETATISLLSILNYIIDIE
ncbi:MAG: RsmE family RNA methyltransferase, partial [Gammaproteobacteria bacterium]|nr:RsmE family RNA methyltransferase [Gammaproteobacteria bacterium]